MQEKLHLYFGVLNLNPFIVLFNELPKGLTRFLPPLSMSVSSVSVAIFFLVFDLTSSFITLYFSNSSKIIRNFSSVTLFSLKALETCEAMVSSFAEAIVLIFSCFSALDVAFFMLYLPIILRNPVESATPSIAMTAGAAITVDNKATPPAPPPMVIAINPFPNKPWFLRICSTNLLKTLWEKEKLLVASNFSFSHSVFYPFWRTFCHFHHI